MDYQKLRILSEAVDSDTVLDILGRSGFEASTLMIKASKVLGKEITKAKTEKDPKKKKKLWKEALRDAKALRKAAEDLPKDGIADHTFRLITSPWWSSVMSYGKAAISKDEKMSELTKDSVVDMFDIAIKYIEHELEELEGA